MTASRKASSVLAAVMACAVALIGMTDALGIVSNFSPVPHWDMWTGYLGFYLRTLDGDWQVWWAPHNEHRIVLAKLLFWIDLAFFSGTGAFLAVTNFVIVASAGLAMGLVARHLPLPQSDEPASRAIRYLAMGLVMSWVQSVNLTWNFQGQFLLAYLLPLTAFWAMCRGDEPARWRLALALGAMSVLTMANGVLALPFLTVQAALMRLPRRQVVLLGLVSIAATGIYLLDYSPPPNHGSLLDTLRNHGMLLYAYVLAFIGGPSVYLSHIDGLALPVLTGTVLVMLFVHRCFDWFRSEARDHVELALLVFLAYIGASAILAGGGRLVFGVEQALSVRYQTPALWAWASLLVLYSAHLLRLHWFFRNLLLLGMGLLLLMGQIAALGGASGMKIDRLTGALALELDIPDRELVETKVYFDLGEASAIARIARASDLSIFGNPLIRDAGQVFGQDLPPGTPRCEGAFKEIVPIKGSNYTRVSGWIVAPDRADRRRFVADSHNRVVGLVFTGPRYKGRQAFKGYVLSGTTRFVMCG